jgi:hypothetical protein
LKISFGEFRETDLRVGSLAAMAVQICVVRLSPNGQLEKQIFLGAISMSANGP